MRSAAQQHRVRELTASRIQPVDGAPVLHCPRRARAHQDEAVPQRRPCTRVRIYNEAGDLLSTRWVCPTRRQRMRLPGHDVDFCPGDTEVADTVMYQPSGSSASCYEPDADAQSEEDSVDDDGVHPSSAGR